MSPDSLTEMATLISAASQTQVYELRLLLVARARVIHAKVQIQMLELEVLLRAQERELERVSTS